MNSHTRVDQIMRELEGLELYWKTCVIGVWDLFNFCIELQNKGEQVIVFHLPSSETKILTYPIKTVLVQYQKEFTAPMGLLPLEQRLNLDHLVTMFGRLNALADEGKELWPDSSWHKFVKHASGIAEGSMKDCRYEFANTVRNIYVHANARYRQKDLTKPEVEEFAKSNNLNLKVDDMLDFRFEKYEEWHHMVYCLARDVAVYIKTNKKSS